MVNNITDLTTSKDYKALLNARKKLVWPLLIIVIGTYMSYILAVAFIPEFLGQTVGDGVTSIGIVLGVSMIFFMFLITLFYVRQANKHIEPLIEKIHAKTKGE